MPPILCILAILPFFIHIFYLVEKSKGESKDYEANDQWHRDLCELSATKMLYIAQHISNEGKIKRIQERQIGQQISNAVKTGTIKLEALKEGIQSKINI
ncbi:hypothetical protein IIA28_05420 [candidate division KSB1 bacterium]|nr:hypothetical protein [candidate division KSB1 bacterium]